MDGKGAVKLSFCCGADVELLKESPIELGYTSYYIHQGEMKLVCEHSELLASFQSYQCVL
jgi:hypothetical protein